MPIYVFRAAKLDITRAKVIDKEPARIVRVLLYVFPSVLEGRSGTRVYDRRHFCGACVIEVQGEFHLFDIDRGDIKRGVFNPFLVRLPRAVRTVEEAYLSLVSPAWYREAIKRIGSASQTVGLLAVYAGAAPVRYPENLAQLAFWRRLFIGGTPSCESPSWESLS